MQHLSKKRKSTVQLILNSQWLLIKSKWCPALLSGLLLSWGALFPWVYHSTRMMCVCLGKGGRIAGRILRAEKVLTLPIHKMFSYIYIYTHYGKFGSIYKYEIKEPAN